MVELDQYLILLRVREIYTQVAQILLKLSCSLSDLAHCGTLLLPYARRIEGIWIHKPLGPSTVTRRDLIVTLTEGKVSKLLFKVQGSTWRYKFLRAGHLPSNRFEKNRASYLPRGRPRSRWNECTSFCRCCRVELSQNFEILIREFNSENISVCRWKTLSLIRSSIEATHVIMIHPHVRNIINLLAAAKPAVIGHQVVLQSRGDTLIVYCLLFISSLDLALRWHMGSFQHFKFP
jgi:hypothetical protein